MVDFSINWVYFSTGAFGRRILKILIEKYNIKPKLIITTNKELFLFDNIKFDFKKIYEAESFNLKTTQKNIIDLFKQHKIELAVLCDFKFIIPKKILNLPKYGFLNIHPSLLPKYRGPSPIQSALLNGDKFTGVSIFLMDEKLDHGPILTKKKFIISKDDNFITLSEKLSQFSADLLIKTIPQWIEDKILPEEQDDSQATFTKKIKKNSGKIDWNSFSSEYIVRMIKAFYPWPSVFTYINTPKKKNLMVKITDAKISSPKNIKKNLNPGEIIIKNRKDLYIKTIDCKFLKILKIKPHGKKELEAKDFINGYF